MRVVFTLALMFVSLPGVAADLSDATAKGLAAQMERTVANTRQQINDEIAKGSRSRCNSMLATLNDRLHEWPGSNLSERAIFPYDDCKSAAVAMIQYGQAWCFNDQSKVWRDHVLKKFREDYAGCQQALVKPDMSLKEIH